MADKNIQDKAKKLKKFVQNPDLARFENDQELSEKLDGIKDAIENIKFPEIKIPESHLENAELIKGLKGDKGDKGDQGEKGDKGEDSQVAGPMGPKGDRGEQGESIEGPEGPMGPMGPKGDKGEQGEPGKDGRDGSRDTAFQIRDKILTLEGDDRIHVGALRGVAELQDQLAHHVKAQVERGMLYAGLLQNQSTGSGGGGLTITLKTNGTTNGSQTLLNLVAGSNITITDNGSGSVTIASSGGGTPGGSDTQIQYNKLNAFAADSQLIWDYTDKILAIGNPVIDINLNDGIVPGIIFGQGLGGSNGYVSIQADNAVLGSNASGLEIDIITPSGDGTGNGGTFEVQTGDGGASGGTGGAIFMRSGQGGGNGAGGGFTFSGGNGSGAGAGGGFTLQGGQGGNTGTGGTVNITGGLGGNGGTPQPGGAVTITSGQGKNGGNGGNLTLAGADAISDNGTTAGTAGSVTIQGGSVSDSGGTLTGTAGPINITAGGGGPNKVNGATVTITGGAGGTNGNRNGGSIILVAGLKHSAGTNGTINFKDPTSGIQAIFATSTLATSDKTFTFPNVSGTFITSGDTGTVTGTMIVSSVALGGSPTTTTQSASDNSTNIATTAYVTTAIANAIAGVNPAVAVQWATTVAGDTSGMTYNNGVSGVGATMTGPNNTAITIDGHTFVVGDVGVTRLLIKNDTQAPSGAFNGVYLFTALQTAITGAVFTRALDYDTPSDINNTGAIPVLNGTANALTSWLLNSTITTVGTSPITYTQFSFNPSRIVPANLGGTGIANNAASTITISGSFATTITVTNTTAVTFPTSGTLVSSVTTGNGVSAVNTAGALAFTLGAITPTTVNGLTISTTTGTLTITNGKTLSISNSLTLAGTDGTTMTFPGSSDTVVTLGATQTLTSKTLTSPVINGATSSGSTAIDFSGNSGAFKTTTGTTTIGGQMNLAAGTTAIAPILFASGTNLTSATAGAVEYDGVQFYHTIDTTSGRGSVPVEQIFHLTANGGTISTIANFFGTTSNISLVASAYYIIDIYALFLNTTAGTVTWTFTNSSAPTSQQIFYEQSPLTGVLALGSAAATYLEGTVVNDSTAAFSFTTGTLTTAVNHYAHWKIILKNGTGTSLLIQATKNVGGTITPLLGSYWVCRRISPNNIGTFHA